MKQNKKIGVKNIPFLFFQKIIINKERKKSRKSFLIISMITILILSGCAGMRVRGNLANEIAKDSNLKPALISTSNFKLKGYYRFNNNYKPLTVYIEGDGQAYLQRNMPSPNPTPRNPLTLRLAGMDRSHNVLYLARPCQYVNFKSERLCKTPFWTQKRFSREVIISVNEAIDKMLFKAKGEGIHLVGYSGGGAVAALVASIRKDVFSLRTLAGYMDHVSLNRRVKVSPLKGSLDPIKVAPKLQSIPQIHYSGIRDKVIPKWVAKKFSHAVGNKKCTSVQLVNTSHGDGWDNVWKKLWSKIPSCR